MNRRGIHSTAACTEMILSIFINCIVVARTIGRPVGGLDPAEFVTL